MRYTKSENSNGVNLIGKLLPNSNVKIKMIGLKGSDEIDLELDDDTCNELQAIEGLYKFNTSNIKDDLSDFIEIVYKMYNEDNIEDVYIGKATISGVYDNLELIPNTSNDITTLKKFMEGNWKIENNQMNFYDKETDELIATYNLFDKKGNRTETNVYHRIYSLIETEINANN